MILNFSITLISFLLMEGVAWLTHKYIMHGLLWSLHKDHHTHENEGVFEKNDFFFLIFALPGIACLLFGLDTSLSYLFWVGTGITLYGAAYFFIHDLFIHQRIKVLRNTKNRYFLAIRRAHKVHHKNRDKEKGKSFGMLMVPLKYFSKPNN